jgi:integrase
MRITGPYRHGKAYRCRLETASGRVCCPCAATPEQALAAAEVVAAELRQHGALSFADAIAAYVEWQHADKGNRSGSLATSSTVLRRFFAPLLGVALRQLKPADAQRLYDSLCSEPSPRTGKPLATDSHRNYLAQAKTFLAWAVEQKLVGQNALAGVRGRGRRRHGKTQLRLDEARRLARVCLVHAQRGDDGALAVLLALLLWLRASEITQLTVRSIDDGGRLLHIAPHSTFEPKSRAGHRVLEVPLSLQPLLTQRTRHRLPGAYLLPAEDGRPHWRDWVTAQVERFCTLAEVPIVCAHALRGTGATAAVQSGIAPAIVAALLGHEEEATTLQSYAAPGSAEHARRAAAVLRLSPPVPTRSQAT